MRSSRNPFLTNPVTSLLVFFGALVLGVILIGRPKTGLELGLMFRGDSRNVEGYKTAAEIMEKESVVIFGMHGPSVFTRRGIEAVRRVSEAFLAYPDVLNVKSLTHAVKPVRRGLSFEMAPLIEDYSEAGLEEFREYALGHPLIRNVMVAPDGRHSIILVTFRGGFDTPSGQERLNTAINDVLDEFRSGDLQFQVLSLPLVEREVRLSLISDISVFAPYVFALMVILFAVTFRRFREVMIALVSLSAMAGVLLVLAGAAGFELNIYLIVAFVLVAGVQLSFLAHLLTALDRQGAECGDPGRAIACAVDEVFRPSLAAGVTTVVGLLSLTLSRTPQVRDFGVFGAMGTAAAFMLVFGPCVAVVRICWVSRLQVDVRDAIDGRDGGLWLWLVGFVRARRKWILPGAVVLLISGGSCLWQMRVGLRMTEFLSPESHTRRALEEFDRVYGGINITMLEFDSSEAGGVNNRRVLNAIEDIHRYSEGLCGVTAVYSYPQVLAMMNQVWNGGGADAMRLPENEFLLNLFTGVLRIQEFPFLRALTDKDFRVAYLIVRTHDMPTTAYVELMDKILAYARSEKPEYVTVSTAQGMHSVAASDRRIVYDLLNTAGLAAAAVFLSLLILWRSIPLAAVALVMNAGAVIFGMGMAGLAGISINSVSLAVAAVVFGIIMDDSVHFLTYWLILRRKGVRKADALELVVQRKSRAIILTSLIFTGVSFGFVLSSFPPVTHFGVVSVIAFLAGLVGILFIFPAFIEVWSRD